jgi:hypothetical protein
MIRPGLGGLAAAALALAAPSAWPAEAPGPLLDAGWAVQRQWQEIQRDGSFDYALTLTTWNSRGDVKETYERKATVRNRDGEHVSVVRSVLRNGKDETTKARREEERERKRPRAGRGDASDRIPSPFDPEFRDKYDFRTVPGRNGEQALEFHPRERFDKALEGTARFDPDGRLRRVEFTLAKLPVFTKRLSFEIDFDEQGLPAHVRTEGEVSLLVWRRRFETIVEVSGVEPARSSAAARLGKEEP